MPIVGEHGVEAFDSVSKLIGRLPRLVIVVGGRSRNLLHLVRRLGLLVSLLLMQYLLRLYLVNSDGLVVAVVLRCGLHSVDHQVVAFLCLPTPGIIRT